MSRGVQPEVAALLAEFARRLDALGWVEALWVGGSAATGDHVPGVSDLDLVAITAGPVTAARLAVLVGLHREFDAGAAAGADLGCQYADAARLPDVSARHPTWTHARLVERPVSALTRVELVRHGRALLGPGPALRLPPVGAEEVRAAARAELAAYWSHAARRPWWFLTTPVLVDLGLTSMARARHAIGTGELLTKSAAAEQVRAPARLGDQVRARRQGLTVASPRLAGAFHAWRDVRRTTRERR